jgi:hypothetical protein
VVIRFRSYATSDVVSEWVCCGACVGGCGVCVCGGAVSTCNMKFLCPAGNCVCVGMCVVICWCCGSCGGVQL